MLRAFFPRAAVAFALCALVFGCRTSSQSASSTEAAASVVSQALGAAGDSGDAGATGTGDAGATGTPACTVDADCGNGCGVCSAGVCSVAANTVVCRAAVDATCDVAEKCDGTSKDCPADGFQPSTLACHPSLGACDPEERCDGAGHCPVDAKLGPAAPACRPATGFCDVAEVCDGVGNTCPTDKFQPTSLECHPKAGVCDVAEKCDGAGNCPTDLKLGPTDPPCGPALLPCDVAESCDGLSNDCPADAIDPGTKVCRPAVDATCDVAEKCDGVSKACPADFTQPASVGCRAAADLCDVAESCDGVGHCAPDAKQPAGHVCHPAAGECDLAEVCNGTTNACPAIDAKQPSTHACGTIKGLCDKADFCTGSSDTCPDTFLTASATCRSAVPGDCDVEEKCTGVSSDCPTDAFQPATHACRPASTDPTSCDVSEFCSGGDAVCPADKVAPSTVVCRPLIPQQPCDQPEFCNGVSKTCPSNAFKPKGSGCDDGLGCTQTDTCDDIGHCNGTPNNSLCPQEDCALNVCDPVLGCQQTILKAVPPALPKVCRKAIGTCDVDEVCDGTNATCPADIIKPATTTCQAATCVDANLKPQILCDGAQGKCPVVADISCGNFACGSTTVCRTTCVTSADCGTAFYCLNNDCVPRIGAGQQCKVDAECSVSNPHCVDGVCCDTTCVGQCEACNTAGKAGTCVGVKGNPIAPRIACAADGTNCDGFCDPSNRTACQFPNKSMSCRDPACDTKTNAAIAESFCTGKGSCALTDSIGCEPYACNGTACAGACSADAQCASDAYCQAGKCTPKGKPADKCTTDKQCGSGHCADGVCCDTACTGQCEACSGVPDAKAGTCSPVTGDPLGKRTACAAADAACGGTCDGKNHLSCIYPAQGKVCRPGACTDGTASVNAYCDGHGACPSAVSITCEKGCEGKVCAGDECVSDKDCGDDAKYCAAGVCTPKGEPGSACSVATSCKSGFCTDGVCCDSACLGQCEACDASGSMGTCSAVPKGDSPHGGRTACATDGSLCGGVCDGSARNNCKYPFDVVCRAGACTPGAAADDPATSVVEASCVGNGSCPAEQQQLCGADGCDSKGKQCDGACAADKNACKSSEYCAAGECVPRLPIATACANDAQCGSKFCVDGVCCNQRCGDQCAACDAPGSVGTCTPVVGGSHGGRAACGGVGTCGAACDGTVVASCGFAGKDVSCGEPFCSAGLRGDSPQCDGEGVCAPAVTTECKSYRCEGTECSTACVHNTDCVKQLECRDGQCVPPLLIDAVDKGSCGCAVPGSRSRAPASVFFLLGLGAAAAFRRRRHAA